MIQLVFLPGLASNSVMWRDQLQAIPGHLNAAVTDVHSRYSTVTDMAQALLNDHGGDLLLCGASMGGMLAMEVVRQAPHRIKGLALLGTNARPESPDMHALRESAIALFEQGRAAEILRANLPFAFHPSRSRDMALHQTYMDFVLAAGADQLISQNRAVMSRPDARLHLPHVRCPTLVMCGDADRLTPPDCSEEIAALIPGADLVIVAQCGHMLTMEQPGAVNQALKRWLSPWLGNQPRSAAIL